MQRRGRSTVTFHLVLTPPPLWLVVAPRADRGNAIPQESSSCCLALGPGRQAGRKEGPRGPEQAGRGEGEGEEEPPPPQQQEFFKNRRRGCLRSESRSSSD